MGEIHTLDRHVWKYYSSIPSNPIPENVGFQITLFHMQMRQCEWMSEGENEGERHREEEKLLTSNSIFWSVDIVPASALQ